MSPQKRLVVQELHCQAAQLPLGGPVWRFVGHPAGTGYALRVGDGDLLYWNIRSQRMIPIMAISKLRAVAFVDSRSRKMANTSASLRKRETCFTMTSARQIWDVECGKRFARVIDHFV